MISRAGDIQWPADIGAEKSILGAVMLDPKCLVSIMAEVEAEDFYHPAHRLIFEAMTQLDSASKPIDAITIWTQLRAMGVNESLNQEGGERYLADLTVECASISSAPFHAASVALKAQRRRWVQEAIGIRERGISGGDDAEFLAASERVLLSLTTRKRCGGPVGLKPVMHSVASTLERRWTNRHANAITGIASGLEDLDALTNGWQPSDLVIIAGRPSMGKTAAALACAAGAVKTGVHCLIFSLEMSKEALAERLVAMDAGVDSMQLRSGHMTTATWMNLGKSFSRVAEYPMWIDDQGALTIGEVRSRARRWRMNEAAKAERVVIVVDYIGLAKPDRENAVREREVAEVSAGLKSLAKELKAPVVALSQLNRSCESRADKRPMLSDLRESGAIEQDADVIAFLYRDEVYHDRPMGQCSECAPGVAEVIVAKQRNGATGTIHVGWQAPSVRFVNLSRRD